jgi:hypothetical protein
LKPGKSGSQQFPISKSLRANRGKEARLGCVGSALDGLKMSQKNGQKSKQKIPPNHPY